MSTINPRLPTLQELYENIRHKDLRGIDTQSTFSLRKTLKTSANIQEIIDLLEREKKHSRPLSGVTRKKAIKILRDNSR